MTRSLESYSTWLLPSQVERLRRLAREYRVPAAVILREVLDDALDEWEDTHHTHRWLEDR